MLCIPSSYCNLCIIIQGEKFDKGMRGVNGNAGIKQGRSQDFSKGEGGHTVSNIIVLAFSTRNILGCLLKKGLQRGGGGHGHPRTPPRYALVKVGKV